ncbi:MAG: hypothetical protein IJF14_03065, partial [Clostridia bacterium]|nr:hypothetical protein [Clostridia bacterium]
ILITQNGATLIAMVIVGFSKKIRYQIFDLVLKQLIHQLFQLTTTIIIKRSESVNLFTSEQVQIAPRVVCFNKPTTKWCRIIGNS